MSASAFLSRRLLRAGLLLLGGWAVLEYALMTLIAARIGWGMTLVLLSLKGGLGLLLVGWMALRGLRKVRLARGTLGASLSLGFSVASGVLIALPGLVPALVGIALFSPSLRSGLVRRLAGKAGTQAPRDIDLEPEAWREVKRRKLARRPRKVVESSRRDALEAKPPSV